ncbi:hypothetical protein SEA_ARAGOG_79 [Mycobacterium phage Aragog]|nr:hypothetical protein SEA_FORGETIT_80 [Mycobacterium phage ForGetIt]ATW61025.1 hypothetical protein SEA_ARAGOG_79 [Mycobacterium phage Aragog]QAX92752.1 hypothetical protein SEA_HUHTAENERSON15_77 [Mycobacterium phage HuhtaEnerson15]WNN94312.1 hypothetical protein SEA_PICKLEBACK_80 [Mycobacterium phage PickleBack]
MCEVCDNQTKSELVEALHKLIDAAEAVTLTDTFSARVVSYETKGITTRFVLDAYMSGGDCLLVFPGDDFVIYGGPKADFDRLESAAS